jgi:hypothetical protein
MTVFSSYSLIAITTVASGFQISHYNGRKLKQLPIRGFIQVIL